MEQHKGKIVEAAIKKSGFRMKTLASKLGIARNTLYIKLKEADVKEDFIIQIGRIIHYDFANDFPSIYAKNQKQDDDESRHYVPKGDGCKYSDEPNDMISDPYCIRLNKLNKKYLRLMEDYTKLLKILVVLANNNELAGVKQEIMSFIDHQEEED